MATVPVQTDQSVPATTGGWQGVRALREDVDRLFERFSEGFGMPSLRRLFEPELGLRSNASPMPVMPAVDVTEDDTCYRISAELPGMTEADIKVTTTERSLTMRGEKRRESERTENNCHISERSFGQFQRSFTLPPGIDRDKIEAKFEKGLLQITVPKSADHAKATKSVPIKSA